MGLTNFPYGITSFGVPIIGSGNLIPASTGSYFFVSSGTGADTNDGKSPAAPLATVNAAIGKCTADKGDVIILMPGHAETVTATSIALNVAGVQVVGLGSGLKRPIFTYGAAAATITVTGANCVWSNCHFVANFLNVAAAFTIGAAKDFNLVNNTFVDTSSSLNFLSILVTGSTNNAADGLAIMGNYFEGLATSPNAFVSILANEDRLLIADNYVNMAATNDAGHFITLSSKVITGARLLRNFLNVVGATTATVGVFLTGSGSTSTGLVADNYVASLDTTTALLATTGTGLNYIQNFYTGTPDLSGAVWPVADNPA